MGFKLKKNKRFSYSPRYFDDKGEGSPFQVKQKFDGFRTTLGSNKGIKTKFNNALEDFKTNPDSDVNKRTVIIIAVLVLLFLFIIDFDLSIFFS